MKPVCGLGLTLLIDPASASERLVRRTLDQVSDPGAVILFTSAGGDHAKLASAIHDKISMITGRDIPIAGATARTAISNRGPEKRASIMAVLSNSHFGCRHLSIGDHRGLNAADPAHSAAAASEAAASILEDPELSLLLGNGLCGLMFTGAAGTGTLKFLGGMRKKLGHRLPICGGGSLGAFGAPTQWSGLQFCGADARSDATSLLLVWPRDDRSRISFSYDSSWTPISPPVRVTRARGEIVLEVNDTPFGEYLDETLGSEILGNPMARRMFTFICRVQAGGTTKELILMPGWLDDSWSDAGKGLPFFPAVNMEGLVVQLVQLSASELISGAQRACAAARKAISPWKPGLALLFSCSLRERLLNSMAGAEIAEAAKVFGPEVALAGFYAGGEFAPLYETQNSPEGEGYPDYSGCCLLTSSLSAFCVGRTPEADGLDVRPGINYKDLLDSHAREDASTVLAGLGASPGSSAGAASSACIPGQEGPDDTIATLKTQLKTAEEIILVTEKSLKALNARNMAMAEGLAEKNRLQNELLSRNRQLEDTNLLLEIGMALNSQRDREALLSMILLYARQVLNADSGSIYIVEYAMTKPPAIPDNSLNREKEKLLHFTITQSYTLDRPFKGYTMAMDPTSIAGFVASNGKVLNIDDVYDIPETEKFRFNASFDKEVGYRCRSMLALPMRNWRGETIGVLQLINRKKGKNVKLLTEKDVDDQVIPFDGFSVKMGMALATQAAIALDNSLLSEEVKGLFEALIQASVNAVESRDPATSGHSQRVARLSTDLAKKMNETSSGPFEKVAFTEEELKEFEYAALLHDFGKVGVRERVLTKENKISPDGMRAISERFEAMRLAAWKDYLEARCREVEGCLDLEELGQPESPGSNVSIAPNVPAAEWNVRTKDLSRRLENLKESHNARLALIDSDEKTVMEANIPKLLPGSAAERLRILADEEGFIDSSGNFRRALEPCEADNLSIPRGSLNDTERVEMESHVTYTYGYLSKIPWTRDLSAIPSIAAFHHEKPNGSGYPYHIPGEKIPLQSKILAVTDVFDALTATDRPYKKAVPLDKTLAILKEEAGRGNLDTEIVDFFISSEVYLADDSLTRAQTQ